MILKNLGSNDRKNELLIAIFIFAMFYLLYNFNKSFEKPKLVVSQEDSALNFSTTFLDFFSFGNKQMISSLMWTQTLMMSDHQHYKGNDLNSWMYLRFNTITNLDKKFYQAYLFGGQYLSIVKDDVFGAEQIYLKGLEVFPDDLWLNYHAGFNYIYEMGDQKQGLKRFLHILDHPELLSTIPILPSITGKLLRMDGQLQLAFELALNAYKNANDSSIKKKYYNILYAIKAEQDLQCLNGENSKQCHQRDFDGNLYQMKNGKYEALKKWAKFQIANGKRVRQAHPQNKGNQ